jgi:hypothetical protein
LDCAVKAAREHNDRVNARMLALSDEAAEVARIIADAQSYFDTILAQSRRLQFELSRLVLRLDTELDRLASRCE